MKNQINLNESELRTLIRESVHNQLLNEDNPLSRWWKNLRNRYNQRRQYRRDDSDDYNVDDRPVFTDDNNSGYIHNFDDDYYDDEGYNNEDYNDDEQGEETTDTQNSNRTVGENPFWYGGEPGSQSHVTLPPYQDQNSGEGESNQREGYTQPIYTVDDSEVTPNSEDAASNPEGDVPNVGDNVGGDNAATENSADNNQGGENNQNSTNTQPQPNNQQPQPTYQRGQQYGMQFSQQNEEIIRDYINPAYDSITKAYKALYNLIQLGPDKYNHIALLQGKQNEYKIMSEQINQIWPVMRDIRSKMKTILYANGVRSTQDYQHYGIEEQKIRSIISNSIKKALNENSNKKTRKR